MRQQRAEVVRVDEEAGMATIRFVDDASTREVEVPDAIRVTGGMPVTVVDLPGDSPVYAWGA